MSRKSTVCWSGDENRLVMELHPQSSCLREIVIGLKEKFPGQRNYTVEDLRKHMTTMRKGGFDLPRPFYGIPILGPDKKLRGAIVKTANTSWSQEEEAALIQIWPNCSGYGSLRKEMEERFPGGRVYTDNSLAGKAHDLRRRGVELDLKPWRKRESDANSNGYKKVREWTWEHDEYLVREYKFNTQLGLARAISGKFKIHRYKSAVAVRLAFLRNQGMFEEKNRNPSKQFIEKCRMERKTGIALQPDPRPVSLPTPIEINSAMDDISALAAIDNMIETLGVVVMELESLRDKMPQVFRVLDALQTKDETIDRVIP